MEKFHLLVKTIWFKSCVALVITKGSEISLCCMSNNFKVSTVELSFDSI